MKGKKIVATILALALIVFPSFSAKAEVVPDNNTIDIRINQIVLHTSDYSADEVNITRDVAPDGTTVVTIKDKLTNEVRETITEKPLGQSVQSKTATPNSTFLYSLLRHRYDGPVTTSVEIVLDMYSSGSFRQINSVKSEKIFVSSSGITTLEDKSITWLVPGNTFPAISLEYFGSGVITGSATESSGSEFSIDFLESAGFSVNHSTSTTWYFRKYVTMSGTYSLYN